MGLDMYAWTVPAAWAGDEEVDYKPDRDRVTTQIAYWRKFNHLHGWMENLYREKGGEEEFNCTTVRLDIEDLKQLEKDMRDPEVFKHTAGFFFGGEQLDQGDIESLEEFIETALLEIAAGKAVFYDCWW